MKKLFILFLAFQCAAVVMLGLAHIVYADTDTIEGIATSTTDTYEGIADTVTDTFEGQTVASGGVSDEDLTTYNCYEETGTANACDDELGVTSATLTLTAAETRAHDQWIYKASEKTGDYKVWWTWNFSTYQIGAASQLSFFGYTEGIDEDYAAMKASSTNDFNGLNAIVEAAAISFRLAEMEGATFEIGSSDYTTGATSTDYFMELERSGTTLTGRMYTSSANRDAGSGSATWSDNLTVSVLTLNYLQPHMSNNTSHEGYFSSTISDVSIQE